MFYVKMDDLTLWTPNDNNLKIVSPTLNLEVNKIGSFTFKIYPDHKYYNRLEKMRSIISVYQGERTLFKGRIYSDNIDFRRVKKIEVEGLLGYLNDSIVRPYEFSGSVEEYFTMLVNQHNGQVTDAQKFKVGVVTVTDPNNLIARESSNTPKTWDEINEKLIKVLGGYIRIRYEADGNYVDYLSDYTDVSTQEIAFSVNLLDLNLENKANALATCVIPYGAKDEATGDQITITSVNNGLDYIYDEDAVERYGRIYEVVTWEDVTLPANLLSKARLYLADKIKLLNKLTVKAIDLHLADETIEAFKLGDYVNIYSRPHEINEIVLLTAYNMDLTNPSGCTITLGLEKSGYLDSQIDANKEAVNRIDIVRKDMENQSIEITNRVLTETQTLVNESLENSEETTRTMLSEYVTVSDFESVTEEMSTTFNQTSEQFNFQFNNVNERITTENGEILRILEENSKYIRLVDGEIILGEIEAVLTTKIANGRISFLYNDTVEVAYISDQKLYITRAEILESIQIGNFAFVPRPNGNLSFKKVR